MRRWILRALGLMPRRAHHRALGPVLIDPDRAEVIHIRGHRG